jgi:hypothetical protein
MVARSWSCFAPILYVASKDRWSSFLLVQRAKQARSSELVFAGYVDTKSAQAYAF